jgi:ADP-ribose pyrophosphatase YjhB (NUDIX family)
MKRNNNNDMLKIALAIVKNDKGEVLIVKRKKTELGSDGSELVWSFPGGVDRTRGKVLAYDTPEECVVEETLAETGHFVEANSLISERKHPDFPAYIYYYDCALTTTATNDLIMDDLIEQIYWVKPEKLMEYFTTNIDEKVAEHLSIKS